MKSFRDVMIGAFCFVWFILGTSLIIVILKNPQPPCPTHYTQAEFLGTTVCLKGRA